MCGIAGFMGEHKQPLDCLRAMTKAIDHRGPNDNGVWFNDEYSIGLAHTRLSIIDLSKAGHQPMKSYSGRYMMVFNGEIYNHQTIRNDLNNIVKTNWRGHSDTETLLAGFEAWGIRETIEKSIGMFAISVWDLKTNVLTIARDRLGEKPLYYGWQDDTFLFGSELKALKKHPAFKGEINRGALALLLRHNYIPAPYSIFNDISKLEPGCILTLSQEQREPTITVYWSAAQVVETGAFNPFSRDATHAVDELEILVSGSIRQQMMADVPLGAFLSGGVDSSLVVALMQAQSSRPVKTFTIGFNEKGYDEAEHARAVAQHLGTEHTELYVTSAQAMEIIPQLHTLYDEPFSDPSQIPTFLVSQLAGQHVSVSLSGDGGDELFCGYDRYQMLHKLGMLPLQLRIALAKGLNTAPFTVFAEIAAFITGKKNIGDMFHKVKVILASQSVDQLYLNLVSHHYDPASLLIDVDEPDTLLTGNMPEFKGLNNIQKVMALDLISYLPDDILVKVDRASMAVSLETRVPFLDHRIVEFASSLPQSIKVKDGKTKWPLRQVLYRYVPKNLIERPKMGFGIPLDKWLRGPLRDWAESLLNEDRLEREGFFHPAAIRALWSEYLSGSRNSGRLLWSILMFQMWLDEQ